MEEAPAIKWSGTMKLAKRSTVLVRSNMNKSEHMARTRKLKVMSIALKMVYNLGRKMPSVIK